MIDQTEVIDLVKMFDPASVLPKTGVYIGRQTWIVIVIATTNYVISITFWVIVIVIQLLFNCNWSLITFLGNW